uniref:KRABA domaincontaining protein 2like [Acyrthosiphon pisum] n=1 Tax=Lepeophtheirus salmonis TaxID=72036 RepID=A0A0K2U5V0_LEPSM
MLCTWTQDQKSNCWSEGLRFVQLMKNKVFHSGIKSSSPYETLFGCKARVSLSTTFLPGDIFQDISTEEEL